MASTSGKDESRSLRLLVVEDEALIAMMLETMLEELGHRVVGVAGSVERANALVAEHGGDADAAILDANLGGRSAAPVAATLRAAHIPFVLASGYEARELQALGLEEPHLRKPYAREELARALAWLRPP